MTLCYEVTELSAQKRKKCALLSVNSLVQYHAFQFFSVRSTFVRDRFDIDEKT